MSPNQKRRSLGFSQMKNNTGSIIDRKDHRPVSIIDGDLRVKADIRGPEDTLSTLFWVMLKFQSLNTRHIISKCLIYTATAWLTMDTYRKFVSLYGNLLGGLHDLCIKLFILPSQI